MRLNVFMDSDFRHDVLKMVRGIVRETATGIIKECVEKAGWLESRLEAYLTQKPLQKLLEEELKRSRRKKGELQELLRARVAYFLRNTDEVTRKHTAR